MNIKIQKFVNKVAISQERTCPLKNRPENAESAQMFSTALQKGTLTFRPGKFISKLSFFISIFVSPDDSKCQLGFVADQNYTNNNERRKTVSIKLSRTSSQFNEYIRPIFLPLFFILVLIILAAVLFCFKFYREDIHKRMKSCSTSGETKNEIGRILLLKIFSNFQEQTMCLQL